MKIEFDISDDKIVNFSSGAKNELIHQSQRIAGDIVDEASRIEASRRIYDTNSEVTQSNVKEAANQPRMMVVKKKNMVDESNPNSIICIISNYGQFT